MTDGGAWRVSVTGLEMKSDVELLPWSLFQGCLVQNGMKVFAIHHSTQMFPTQFTTYNHFIISSPTLKVNVSKISYGIFQHWKW